MPYSLCWLTQSQSFSAEGAHDIAYTSSINTSRGGYAWEHNVARTSADTVRLAMELLQSCTEPLKYVFYKFSLGINGYKYNFSDNTSLDWWDLTK